MGGRLTKDETNNDQAYIKAIQTAYLDLYLCHRYNPDIPVTQTMRALETSLEEGLIRNIGVSNFNIQRLEEARHLANIKLLPARST